MVFLLPLALAGAVAAAPNAPSSKASVPSSVYVNGKLAVAQPLGVSAMSGTASTSVSCSVGDDVLECANKVYKNIQVSSDAVSGSHSAVNIRVSINDLYTGFVDVAWDTKLSECVVTPEVVYEGEGVFCNSKSRFFFLEKT